MSLSAEVYRIVPAVMDNHLLRLFFTSDRVVVRVVIRGTELYDLVKINAMELEAEDGRTKLTQCLIWVL